MKNRALIFLVFILFFFAGYSAFAADSMVDPREAAIDRVIGGMVEGSRPLLPQNYAGKNQVHKVPGSNLSPSMDTRVTASTSTESSSSLNSVTSPSGNVAGNESGNPGAGTNETGANLGGTTHETTTGGNLEGNVSGGTETGNVGANLGGAIHETTTGGNLQENLGAGTSGGTETTGSTEPTTEPAGNGGTSDSIINADANVDLSGGTTAVDANLEVDTNAQGGLLDADVAGTTDAGSAEVTAVESGQIAGQDLTEIVESALVDATLDTEVVATDIPVDSEASAGLEASIDETGAGGDVTVSDPADGLSITPSL